MMAMSRRRLLLAIAAAAALAGGVTGDWSPSALAARPGGASEPSRPGRDRDTPAHRESGGAPDAAGKGAPRGQQDRDAQSLGAERTTSGSGADGSEAKQGKVARSARAVRNATSKVTSTVRHYGGKVGEIRYLDRRAVPATKLRLEIMASTRERVMRAIPLRDLEMIHTVTRDPAVEKLDRRVEALGGEADAIRAKGVVDAATQERLIPSKNPIRVIKTREGKFVVFDGNGRLEAIKRAFGDNPELRVEVQEHVTRRDLSDSVRRAQAGSAADEGSSE